MRALNRGKIPVNLPAKALLVPRDIWERKQYAKFRTTSAKRGGLGMGDRSGQQTRVKTGFRSWWSLRTGQGLCLHQVHKTQSDKVVVGWIQALPDPQSHAFQGERKGLLFFFLSFLLSDISKSLWKRKLETGFHCWVL